MPKPAWNFSSTQRSLTLQNPACHQLLCADVKQDTAGAVEGTGVKVMASQSEVGATG